MGAPERRRGRNIPTRRRSASALPAGNPALETLDAVVISDPTVEQHPWRNCRAPVVVRAHSEGLN
jgi:hypothetical protein